ncbi:DUF1697 domain-containing protein [Streptomyces litchfieldiae]|uniref:DUF1697 domain-containing protein n=1 Tax=Streptomyces litchfieldiae TaxID=3075543 RepID=A0ABU2MR50_9ACTN|nr:DUF1697 domain-containing protein [Streptomyces sp. DSM 44938]MDT0344104.1 DUF1697 domain-containing protein [Streptomyces sp. DSM 44938]
MDSNGNANIYVALLRGINVGGHKKVPMAELRLLLTELGHGSARTLLASGNAVFTAPAADPGELTAALEKAIAERFGFPVDCLVLTRDELRATAARCPFPADTIDPARLLVLFLDRPPADTPFAALDPVALAPDEFRLGEREIFAHFPDGMGRSKLGDALAAAPRGCKATGRNWRTVTKLLELAG